MKTWILGLGLVLAALTVAPSFAQEEGTDDECVADCREEFGDCRFDAHEEAADCLEAAGCDVLRDEYRENCLSADRDVEACSAARTAYRECTEPCRTAQRDAHAACREEVASCLEDDCGVELPLRRPGRHGGEFGHGGHGPR